MPPTTSLYMAVDRLPTSVTYGSWYSPIRGELAGQDSFVHKFGLGGTDTSYAGSVTVPGHVLNQFAMDE